ncbi:MAG: ribosomal protein S18-alanine N-acetyltransferase [Sporichthyaceae bacterium]|nr:ribosomal protein S18-alanine N-acetyltransferase [Sporichthyaceae bacterium]
MIVAPVLLEPLRWWHIEQVVAIEADLFGVGQWTPAMFWNELANDHHYIAALAPEGDVLGYAGLAVAAPEAWINNIAVRRDRQRTGIGRLLLEHLLGYGRAHGATHSLLEVAADNGPAQRMYDTYGFEVIGVRRGYYQPSNTDALVLRRDERT